MSCRAVARYVEFAVTSNFSFLRGASHPEELMGQAQAIGLAGLGLADLNSVAGVVRAHVAKREHAMALRYHPGARLAFCDGAPDILAYPRDRAAWGRLCRLLTRGNLRAEKGECLLYHRDLFAHSEGLELIVMGGKDQHSEQVIHELREAAPGRVRLAVSMLYRGDDRARLLRAIELGKRARTPLIAVNDVLYHHPERRPLADVLTCIREHVTLPAAGRRLAVNAERHLKPAAEMARLFRDAPEAVEETLNLSSELAFSLDELRYVYPDETRQGFATPQAALAHFAFTGAAERYPHGVPDKVKASLEYELKLIAELDYAPYFLTVHDIVRFARSRNILCQGRGSAANSAVCFCLGVTEVDPERGDLLFERFVSTERREPPDIDVDFEHERREEVIQYIYQRYGRERAGLAATVISYRARSAIREVGKAFGLSEDTTSRLASSIWGGGGVMREADVQRAGLDVGAPVVAKILAMTREIISFPRHLSQHVGGFVITKGRLDELAPIQNAAMEDRTVIEWDKDDLDALGILKVDVLGLGMLTCVRKAFDLVERHYPSRHSGTRAKPANPQSITTAGLMDSGPRAEARDRNDDESLTLAAIPAEDRAVYRMLQRADSLGVFQVESRAQMSMLPRLKPKEFYDLVIEVAIVRPGPIQGDMVHPYLRRRQGLEPVTFPSKELEGVLGKTLGVPLFQEQAMRIAIVAAGFTPAEADKLRRAMATFKRVGTISTFQRKMVDGMLAKGYERAFAERCFQQIEGFGEYGFPESHAASFALLVYASAWLKCHYPDAFAAALLNAQPMGFYAPAQIVRDAREHGVEVRPVDINHSDWDATLEPGARAAARLHEAHSSMREDIWSTHAIRLGLREVKGLSEEDARRIAAGRTAPAELLPSPRAAQRSAEEELRVGGNTPPPRLAPLADPPHHAPRARGEGSNPRERGGRLEPVDSRDAHCPYTSIRDLWRRTGLSPRMLERLADADAFGSLGLKRRDALWAVKALGRVGDKDDLPLFRKATLLPSPRAAQRSGGEGSGVGRNGPPPRLPPIKSGVAAPPHHALRAREGGDPQEHRGGCEPDVSLPPMPLGEEVVNDYRFLNLSLRAHPAAFLRSDLFARGVTPNATLRKQANDARVTVSGIVTVRQRPGSAAGVVFMTIEDETGIANIIVWPKLFERVRPVVLGARYLIVRGRMQQECGVIHVVAERLEDATHLLARLTDEAGDLDVPARGSAHCVPKRRAAPSD